MVQRIASNASNVGTPVRLRVAAPFFPSFLYSFFLSAPSETALFFRLFFIFGSEVLRQHNRPERSIGPGSTLGRAMIYNHKSVIHNGVVVAHSSCKAVALVRFQVVENYPNKISSSNSQDAGLTLQRWGCNSLRDYTSYHSSIWQSIRLQIGGLVVQIHLIVKVCGGFSFLFNFLVLLRCPGVGGGVLSQFRVLIIHHRHSVVDSIRCS